MNAKFQIYSSLLKAGAYTTNAEAKLKYEMETNKVNFDYVSVAYSTVKDSEVKISDSEIVDFMKKNEKKYKAEETRELEFVVVEDKASNTDQDAVKKEIEKVLSGNVVYNKERFF